MIRPVDQHCREQERKASLSGPPAILKTPTHTQPTEPLPTHHTEQGPFVEGRMKSDELSLGSWLPLNDATTAKRRGGEKVKRGLDVGRSLWPAPRSACTHQGSSSNTGLFRVRKRRMTGFPSWTRGFPVRNWSANAGNSGSKGPDRKQ